MGICNVLAVIPFLCSAPAEEPPEDEQEQIIEAQPAPEVAVNTLTPPPAATRPLSEYEVLPPSSGAEMAYQPSQPEPNPQSEGASSFSDWVNRNWGGEREVAAAEPVVPTPQPRLDLATTSSTSPSYTVDEMTRPELEVEPTPQPYVMSEPEPRLARLEPSVAINEPPAATEPLPEPAPMLNEDVALAERQNVRTARTGPSTVEHPQVALAAPRPQPQPQPEPAVRPAAMTGSLMTNFDPVAALRAGTISFAEPEPFAARGGRVEADGIAARKRRDVRRFERELRRRERDSE